MRFVVEREFDAPAPFVVDWWLDYGPTDAELSPDIHCRSVELLPDGRIRLDTEGRHGKRATRTTMVVTRTGPLAFRGDGGTSLGETPVADLTQVFQVSPTSTGSRLEARFTFRGRGFVYRLGFPLLRRSLRRDREAAHARFARAAKADYETELRPP